jgi:hypothetical protein
VTNFTPRGAERGKTIDITVGGTNLTPKTRLLLPFTAKQEILPDAKPNPAQVRLKLTVDGTVPPGIYPIRLATEDGVSPPLFFHVDVFPDVNEIEDNSTLAKAQKITVPAVVNGQCAGGDIDFFRFPAKKGQRLVVETISARLGSGVLPQLRLTDARGRFLAADDTQALGGDCRLWIKAPEDGEYIVEISDSRYRGAAPPHYRLKIADYDFADEVFPLGGRRGDTVEFVLRGGNLGREVRVRRTLSPAPPAGPAPARIALDLGDALPPGMLPPTIALGDLPEITLPAQNGKAPAEVEVTPPLTVNGRSAEKGAVQRLRFAVKAGERYRLAVQADALGSALDGVLRVSDQGGKQLALVDDVDVPPPAPGLQATKSPDPALEVTVPPGVTALKVELRDGRYRGGINFGYRLTIEPAVPDFLLQQVLSEVNVPRGGTVALTVPVTRRGYNGPIQLGLPALPAGWSVQGGYVPAGVNQGVLTLGAADGVTATSPLTLSIEGQGTEAGSTLRRWAEQQFVVARDANVAVATAPLSDFAVALTAAEAFRVQGPPAIEVVHGYPTAVPVTVTRAAGQKVAAVEVTGLAVAAVPAPGKPPVGALAFKPANAAPDAGQATLLVTAPANIPEGRAVDLVIQGKAKLNNVDRVVVGPAVTVTVLRPFTVELQTPSPALTPGATVVLKGRVQRRPVFKEAVQLKLDGLPTGVTTTAPLKPVAAGQDEFTIELRVGPKVVPAKGPLTLTCSATINGMAYAHPPVIVRLESKGSP